MLAVLGLVPMVALVASRLLGLDDHSGRVFALQTLAPVVLLPAYAFALVALLAWRWLVGTVAVAVALAHAAWTIPSVGSASDEIAAGPRISVLTANVAATNPRPEEVALALDRNSADVVVIIELTPRLRAELERSGFLGRYPHRIEDPRDGFFGSGIYSRLPLSKPRPIELAGLPSVRATAVLGGRSIDVVAVHTMQPLAGVAVLRRQHQELADIARGTTGPLVLAGDFNATTQHRPFRELLDTRVRDSHVLRGRGLARTWPVELGVPTFALLDHVLISEELSAQRVEEVHLPGSDHRGVRADLALR